MRKWVSVRRATRRHSKTKRARCPNPTQRSFAVSAAQPEAETSSALEPAEADARRTGGGRATASVRKAIEESGDRDLAFDARQRHADARVDAARECEVMIRRALDVEPFRLVELRRVAIRGADAQRDLGAGLERRRRRSRVASDTSRLPSWFGLAKRSVSSMRL